MRKWQAVMTIVIVINVASTNKWNKRFSVNVYILHLTSWRSCAISKRLKIFSHFRKSNIELFGWDLCFRKNLKMKFTYLKSSQFLFFNNKLVDNLISSKCLENSFKTHYYWLKVTFLIYIYLIYFKFMTSQVLSTWMVRSAPLQCLNLFWRCNCVRFDFPSHLLTP